MQLCSTARCLAAATLLPCAARSAALPTFCRCSLPRVSIARRLAQNVQLTHSHSSTAQCLFSSRDAVCRWDESGILLSSAVNSTTHNVPHRFVHPFIRPSIASPVSADSVHAYHLSVLRRRHQYRRCHRCERYPSLASTPIRRRHRHHTPALPTQPPPPSPPPPNHAEQVQRTREWVGEGEGR